MYKSKNELAPNIYQILLFLQITRSHTILDFYHHTISLFRNQRLNCTNQAFLLVGQEYGTHYQMKLKPRKLYVFEFKNSYKLLNV